MIKEVFWRIRRGEALVRVKNPFYYEFYASPTCPGNLFFIEMPNISLNSDATINWATEGPIELISGQGTNKASFCAIADQNGYATISTNVDYKGFHKAKKSSPFWVGLPSLTPYEEKQIEYKGTKAEITIKATGHDKLTCELLSGEASISIVNQSLHVKPTNQKTIK